MIRPAKTLHGSEFREEQWISNRNEFEHSEKLANKTRTLVLKWPRMNFRFPIQHFQIACIFEQFPGKWYTRNTRKAMEFQFSMSLKPSRESPNRVFDSCRGLRSPTALLSGTALSLVTVWIRALSKGFPLVVDFLSTCITSFWTTNKLTRSFSFNKTVLLQSAPSCSQSFRQALHAFCSFL